MFGWKLVRRSKLDEEELESYKRAVNALNVDICALLEIHEDLMNMMMVNDIDAEEFCKQSVSMIATYTTLTLSVIADVSILRDNKFTAISFGVVTDPLIRALNSESERNLAKWLSFATMLSDGAFDSDNIEPRIINDVIHGFVVTQQKCNRIHDAILYDIKRCNCTIDIIGEYYKHQKDLKRETSYRFRFLKPSVASKLPNGFDNRKKHEKESCKHGQQRT